VKTSLEFFRTLSESGLKSKAKEIFEDRLNSEEAWIVYWDEGQGLGIPRKESLKAFTSKEAALSYLNKWFDKNISLSTLSRYPGIGIAKITRTLETFDEDSLPAGAEKDDPDEFLYGIINTEPDQVQEFYLLECVGGVLSANNKWEPK